MEEGIREDGCGKGVKYRRVGGREGGETRSFVFQNPPLPSPIHVFPLANDYVMKL
jgi:hypothetical protein